MAHSARVAQLSQVITTSAVCTCSPSSPRAIALACTCLLAARRIESDMVSASTGLKVFQAFGMIMGIMMTTFPQALLGVYGMDFFDCPAKPARGAPPCDATQNKAIAYNCFNFFGVQLLLQGMLCAALSRNGVSSKAQSVALLFAALTYVVFIVSDYSATLDDRWPEQMPKEGVYSNIVMWTGFIVVALLGWKDSGSVTPDFNKLSKITTGRFSLPLLAGCVNLLMFGVPMTFLREMMVSQFGWDDLMKGVPKQVDFMIMVVLGNTGKMMLANSLAMLAIFSAASDDDTVYRLIRAASINGVFFLGAFSKDAVSNLLLGHEDPMRVIAFVQCFAVTYYQVNAFTGAPFTLKKK